jgi:hypothetical protein
MMMWGHEALRVFLTMLSLAMEEIQNSKSNIEQTWKEVLKSRNLCALAGQLKADRVNTFRKERTMVKTFSGDVKRLWRCSRRGENNCKAVKRRWINKSLRSRDYAMG